MFSLEHHVRVFVFQILEREIQYLLVRQKPTAEWPLGPVVGPIGPDEHIQDAVLREVREDTGIRKPLHMLELAKPSKELYGDCGLIQWPFAYQAGTPSQPIEQVVPGPRVGEFAWMGFDEAFQRIEDSCDRDSLVKLRLHLHAG